MTLAGTPQAQAAPGIAPPEPDQAHAYAPSTARWEGPDATPPPNLMAFARAVKQPPLIARLMLDRGLADTVEEAEAFLKPSLSALPDPADMPGAATAATRLTAAVDTRRPIVIYGDYDVDGITASAILFHTLTRLWAERHPGGTPAVATYVPHRIDEGYGVNAEALHAIAEYEAHPELRPEPDPELDGHVPPPLIVTVDCGITAVDAAAAATAAGVELIITDHHTPDPANLPAVPLVHPDLPGADGTAAERDINDPAPCGAGVAFMVAWQTLRTAFGSDRLPTPFQELLVSLLPLAALGTVADIVPLRGMNRVLTAAGLSRIKATPIPGLHALLRESKLLTETVDSYHIGFVLGPRLNACGRLGHAREAVELLTTAEGPRAAELAAFLTGENDRRRGVERAVLEEAVAQVEATDAAAPAHRGIVVAGRGWHPGVVGIVASRLVDRYHRPAIVLAVEDPEAGESLGDCEALDLAGLTAKGSARSVAGVDLHAVLKACAGHLTRFGGHAMAAGMTLPAEAVDAFRDGFRAALADELEPEDMVEVHRYDAQVTGNDIDPDVFRTLQRLAPFGAANRTPRLRINGLRIDRTPARVGQRGRHLTLHLTADGRPVRAICFGRGEDALHLAIGDVIDCVFEPKLNTWNNTTRAELNIRDYRRVR